MFNFFKKNVVIEKLKKVYTDFNQIEDKILFLVNQTRNCKDSKYKTITNHLNGNIDGMILSKKFEENYDKINFFSNEILKLHIEMKEELNNYNNIKFENEIKKLN